MKTIKILFSIIAFSQFSFGQNHKLTDEDINRGTPNKINFINKSQCDQINEFFKDDLNHKTIFVFLQSGIAPVIFTSDEKFESKYGIHFYDYGCISPDHKCIIDYNKYVFYHLTKTYGKKWIKEIRKDVIGLKEWRKN